MESTTIPMPPIQWLSERQKRIDFGSASTSVSMEAPVVERPDMVSKNASVGEGIAPETTNGTAPTTDASSHVTVTRKNPSRIVSEADFTRRSRTYKSPAPLTTASTVPTKVLSAAYSR